jgi:hypothetical protein
LFKLMIFFLIYFVEGLQCVPHGSNGVLGTVECSITGRGFVDHALSVPTPQIPQLARRWKQRHAAISLDAAKAALKSEGASKKPSKRRRLCNEAERCLCRGGGALLYRIERRLSGQLKELNNDKQLKPKLLLSQVVVEFKATPVITDALAVADALAFEDSAAFVAPGAAPPAPSVCPPSVCPPAVMEHIALQYLKPFRSTLTSVQVCNTVEPLTPGGVMIQLRECSAMEVCKTIWESLSLLDLDFAWDTRLHEIYESDRPLGRKLDPTIVEIVALGGWSRIWSGIAVEPQPGSRKRAYKAKPGGTRKPGGSKKKRGIAPMAIADRSAEGDSADFQDDVMGAGDRSDGEDDGGDAAWWDESDDGAEACAYVGEGQFNSTATQTC